MHDENVNMQKMIGALETQVSTDKYQSRIEQELPQSMIDHEQPMNISHEVFYPAIMPS